MKSRSFALVPCLFCVSLIVGCAAPTTRQAGLDPELVRIEEQKQLQLAIKKDREYDERLQRIAWPLQRAAAPLCEGNTMPRLGFHFATIHAYDKKYQPAAGEVLGLDDRLRVIDVSPNGPADQAGIKVGDAILRLNGHEIPAGKNSVKRFVKIVSDALEDDSVLSIDLLRDGNEFSTRAFPEEACRFSAIFWGTDEINAYADGDNIYITRGMMRFADDDQELSLVVAHELAHNSQEHIKAKTKNYLLGAIFDIAAAAYGVNTQGAFGNMAAGTYSQEFEAEADYVGMYMLALADIDLSGAADFWREMGVQHPGSITKSYASSHPSTAERFLAIENAAFEINTKRKDGLVLMPEMKE